MGAGATGGNVNPTHNVPGVPDTSTPGRFGTDAAPSGLPGDDPAHPGFPARIGHQLAGGFRGLRCYRDVPNVARGLMEPVPSHEVKSVIGQRGLSITLSPRLEERAMTILKWALIFFLVSVVAGILGFTGISAASADIARFLFYVFVVIFLVLLILGLTIFRV